MNKNWPDEARQKMVERSESYDNSEVYRYGFYDGYQYAQQQCQKLLREELINFFAWQNTLDISETERVVDEYLKQK